jgi:hypothetical protein
VEVKAYRDCHSDEDQQMCIRETLVRFCTNAPLNRALAHILLSQLVLIFGIPTLSGFQSSRNFDRNGNDVGKKYQEFGKVFMLAFRPLLQSSAHGLRRTASPFPAGQQAARSLVSSALVAG